MPLSDEDIRDAIKLLTWREHHELSALRCIMLQDLIAEAENLLRGYAERSRAQIVADLERELER